MVDAICEVVGRVYVNIVDLIDWARDGTRGQENGARVFRNVNELRMYTISTRRIVRLDISDSDQGNVVLRHLLRSIFGRA